MEALRFLLILNTIPFRHSASFKKNNSVIPIYPTLDIRKANGIKVIPYPTSKYWKYFELDILNVFVFLEQTAFIAFMVPLIKIKRL